MQAGIILGTGKGNDDWNQSAPHGAGRLYKRSDMRQILLSHSLKSDGPGIYSSCVSEGTLDEAPFAYRNLEDILQVIGDTVDVDQVIHPIYNYKRRK